MFKRKDYYNNSSKHNQTNLPKMTFRPL